MRPDWQIWSIERLASKVIYMEAEVRTVVIRGNVGAW